MTWLYIPSASALAPVGSISASTSPALECSGRSIMLRGKSPSSKSLRIALNRGKFPLLRSGLTCEQSAMQVSAILWARPAAMPVSAYSPPAIRVSRLASAVTDAAAMIHATYGPTLLARLKSINQLSYFSKTCGVMSLWGFERSPSHWRRWVMEWQRKSLARRKLGVRRGARGCLFWRAPTATDYKGGSSKRWLARMNGDCTPRLSDQIQVWHGSRRDRLSLTTSTVGDESRPIAPISCRGSLNPKFAEWLMGVPVGWTGYAPAEMGSYRQQQLQLLHNYFRTLFNENK